MNPYVWALAVFGVIALIGLFIVFFDTSTRWRKWWPNTCVETRWHGRTHPSLCSRWQSHCQPLRRQSNRLWCWRSE